jgi:hypothetical protein
MRSILLALLLGLASLGAAQASDPSQVAPDSAPPRIVLQSPRFPKLQAELQPVLPLLTTPDPNDAMPPRIALQLPRFPNPPELQPVLPVFAVPDSHSPEPLHVPFIRRQMTPP